MGHGDQLLGTGMARGAAARGEKIAFGDGRKIIWDKHSSDIFRGNPNIAKPGAERDQNTRWRHFYKGNRLYNSQDAEKRRWIWNLDFHATPGEVFFEAQELRNSGRFGDGFILLEPDVPHWKSVAPNKDWGRAKYQALADKLRAEGHRLAQFRHDKSGPPLTGVAQIRTMGFRDGLAIMRHALLYIGAEGGLHHGAAAVDRPAVVLFGGFIPPSVTGYETHTNLTGGAEACGNYTPCDHCRQAMAAISVEEVFQAAMERL